MPPRPLTGKSRIAMTSRVEAQDARLVPRRFPETQGTRLLYVQRRGDEWTIGFPARLWYASAKTHEPKPGAWEVTAYFESGWTSMTGVPCENVRPESPPLL